MTSGGRPSGTLSGPVCPWSVAKAMTGHKTDSIYRRYAIVDDAMLREGMAKLARYSEAQ